MKQDKNTFTCSLCGCVIEAAPHRLDPRDHHQVTWSVTPCLCLLKCLNERISETIRKLSP